MSHKKIDIISSSESNIGNLKQKIIAIKEDIAREYSRKHNYPWILAFSGGKDSTLLAQLVFEVVLSVKKEKRKRPIFLIANDTLVESPLVIRHLYKQTETIKKMMQKNAIAGDVAITKPSKDDTFWVNLIGRGYPPPTRFFRWCTDRMKIEPTNSYVKKKLSYYKKLYMLLGVRSAESSQRKKSIQKHTVRGSKFSPHSLMPNCFIYKPIKKLSDDEVWLTLFQRKPPWGGSHRDLITLYRNAKGGECPLVITKDDAPSCGTTSPRFGCWMCTVVEKDKSLGGLIDSGFEEFVPLLDFRDEVKALRDDRNNRMDVRRDGKVKRTRDGSIIPGPFKLEVREALLKKVLRLQKEMQMVLISEWEIAYIKKIWEKDRKILSWINFEYKPKRRVVC